jgi:hypothetical protein
MYNSYKVGYVELPTSQNPSGAQETCGRERIKQSRVLEKLTMPQLVKGTQKALTIIFLNRNFKIYNLCETSR